MISNLNTSESAGRQGYVDGVAAGVRSPSLRDNRAFPMKYVASASGHGLRLDTLYFLPVGYESRLRWARGFSTFCGSKVKGNWRYQYENDRFWKPYVFEAAAFLGAL